MKTKSLQIGKAMSAALFVLLLVVAGSKNALAQTQVATLQHGDDISVFYGTNAFVEAHTAAADGDIVTLSGGSYTAPTTITKAITLRGAGVVTDTVAGTTPTVFGGAFVFNIPNDSIACIIEGILFNDEIRIRDDCQLINPKFTRCNIKNIIRNSNNHSGGSMINAQFVNCKIEQFNLSGTPNATIINSIVWQAANPNGALVYNSIFGIGNYDVLSAHNSIIICRGNPSPTSGFYNCIGIKTGYYSPFGSAYTSGCTTYTSYEDVFENFTGTFSFEEPFILKEEIASSFLGTDGTEVGVHGGPVPYTSRPTYMILRRCNVASRSTVDGKLSVEIEVVTEE